MYEVAPEEVVDDATKVFARIHPDDLESVGESIRVSRHNLDVRVYAASQPVRLEATIDDVSLDTGRIFPLGAIVTELLTNSLKYAFSENSVGTVELSLVGNGARAILSISDDGRGLPKGFDPASSEGFGLTLVKALVEQIDGTLTIESSPGKGTRSTVSFSI